MVIDEIAEEAGHRGSFQKTLEEHGLVLKRDETRTLQVNIGYQCNQTCLHCHLNAGPGRKEMMTRSTMEEVISYAGRAKFETIDITGGAPELHPLLPEMIAKFVDRSSRTILRSNISVLNDGNREHIIDLLHRHQVVIIASFPSLNRSQSEAQRGKDTYHPVIEGIRRLNNLGYGHEGTGLELDLVSNPAGAFLPPSQCQQEKRFRRILEKKWGIAFNNLYNFANVPLGRFKRWLIQSGNYENYMDKLTSGFNPSSVDGLMCRSLISVSWDGFLFDCDFNQAERLHMGGDGKHVSKMSGIPETGTAIISGEHCYTCTAGAGFT